MDDNRLTGGEYAEPYAGGAGIAVNLLSSGHATHVHINDINPAVFAFWKCVFESSDDLCHLIRQTPVSIKTWNAQREVMKAPASATRLELGFATFFLNRTNRSGILDGGVIGGKEQNGKWKIDARYNKDNLCHKIETLSTFGERVSLYNLDAEEFIRIVVPKLPRKTLVYFDPPYFVKSGRLYQNLYSPSDHSRIASKVAKLRKPWVISYDDVPQIREMYSNFRMISYPLPYSAAKKYLGAEALFLSPRLKDVDVASPLEVRDYD